MQEYNVKEQTVSSTLGNVDYFLCFVFLEIEGTANKLILAQQIFRTPIYHFIIYISFVFTELLDNI